MRTSLRAGRRGVETRPTHDRDTTHAGRRSRADSYTFGERPRADGSTAMADGKAGEGPASEPGSPLPAPSPPAPAPPTPSAPPAQPAPQVVVSSPEPSRWRHFQLKLIELLVLGIPIGLAANFGIQHWVAERNRLELQIERESREAMAEREMWKDAAARLDEAVMPVFDSRVRAFLQDLRRYGHSDTPLSELDSFNQAFDLSTVFPDDEQRSSQVLLETSHMAEVYDRPYLVAAITQLQDSTDAIADMRFEDFVDTDVAFRPLLMAELDRVLREAGYDPYAPEDGEEAARVQEYIDSNQEIGYELIVRLIPAIADGSDFKNLIAGFGEDYKRVKVMLLSPQLGAMDEAYIDPSTSPDLADMDERIRAAEELLERVTARAAEEAAAEDESDQP